MNYQTINLSFKGTICFLQFNRPEHNNTINKMMIDECHHALDICENKTINILVIRGSTKTFCFGADFHEISHNHAIPDKDSQAQRLYELWERLTLSRFITIAHVHGNANAGGIGFIAASDIVIAEPTANFSLSELLFGLFPACVLPFLIRRIGFQKSNYLTITTKPISAETAKTWGLVDECDFKSENLLRMHLTRLSRLSSHAIQRYKKYINHIFMYINNCKSEAIRNNQEIFSDKEILNKISHYVSTGVFPWESTVGNINHE